MDPEPVGRAEEGEPPPQAMALLQATLEPTFVIAAFGLALLIVKVTRVSHLNARTSHGVIEGVGPLSVVLGTLVGHLPAILFVICLLGMWWAIGSFTRMRTFAGAHGMAIGALFLAVLLLPWPYLLVLAGVGAFRWWTSVRAPDKVGTRSRHYYFLIGAAAVLLVVDAEMWIPPERFHLQDGTSFVGYELGDQAGWDAVLTEEERMILRIKEDEVADREPCRLTESDYELANFPSLMQLAIGENVELPEPHCFE